jgi:hypothetical protein
VSHVMVFTNAPVAYDWLFTFEGSSSDGKFPLVFGRVCRVVFIPTDRLSQQVDRYQSGSYLAVEASAWQRSGDVQWFRPVDTDEVSA